MQPQSRKSDPDIIAALIEDGLEAFPVSPLLIGLYQQYQKKGFLTKKQMQGLYSKISGLAHINSGRLATLEAIINKMPNRFKSEKPKITAPVFEKDQAAGAMLASILEKYPLHKRAVFLKAKYDNNEVLSSSDIAELKKFILLLKL